MNRAARRALKRTAARGLKHAAPDSLTLIGGPMDGWAVKPDAPALRPDWYTTWPSSVAARHQPGRYVLDSTTRRATWEPTQG